MHMKKFQHLPGIIVAVFCFMAYWLTLAPSISSQDAGELATAQYFLDIAHPTGYPLFTLVGFLWSKIPLGLSPIFQLNLLAAICTSTSLFVLFQTVLLFMSYSGNRGESKDAKVKTWLPISVSIFTLAFGQTFWYQSTGTEVYSLHLLLMSLVLWQTFKAYLSTSIGHHWKLVGFFVGLSMCNHLTTVLILPGIIYLYFIKEGLTQKTLKLTMAPLVISLLTITLGYSYLLIRSNQEVLINWGNPSNLQNLYDHISGKLYHGHAFNSWNVSMENLVFFTTHLSGEYSIPALFLVLAGLLSLRKKLPTFFVFSVGTIVLSIGLVMNYNIPDLQSYFLLVYVIMTLLLAQGINWLCGLPFFRRFTASRYLLFLLPVLAFFSNFKTIDQSENMVLHNYATNQLKSVPPDAIILSTEYDTFISSSYYFQHVENLRKDVTIIDFLALLDTDWYAGYLTRYDPELGAVISKDLTNYDHIRNAQGTKNWSLSQQQEVFKALIHNLIALNGPKRPIFISHLVYRKYLGPGGHLPIPNTYQITPQNYLYQVTPTHEYLPLIKEASVELSFPFEENPYTQVIQSSHELPVTLQRDPNFLSFAVQYRRSLMLDHRIQYELRWGQFERAKKLHNLLESEFTDYQIPDQMDKLFHGTPPGL